jgi:hypothetical protein
MALMIAPTVKHTAAAARYLVLVRTFTGSLVLVAIAALRNNSQSAATLRVQERGQRRRALFTGGTRRR